MEENYKNKQGIKEIAVPYEIELTGDLEISDFPNLAKFKFALKSGRGEEILEGLLGGGSNNRNKNIAQLKITNCPQLNTINLRFNKIKEVFLDNCSELKDIDLEKCRTSKLEIKNCSKIVSLDVSDCNLSELNLDNLTELKKLDARNNQLTELNLSNNEKLVNLLLDGNPWNKNPLEGFGQLKKDFLELKGKLANIEEEAQKLSGADSSGQTILNQLEESKKKLQEYEDKEKEYQTKIAGLEEYANKQEQANEALYNGSNKRIEELTAEKDKLIAQRKQLETNWNNEKQNLQLQITNLERELEKVKRILKNSESEKEKLQQELREKEQQIEELTQQIATLQSEIQELKDKIAHYEQQTQHLEQEKANYEQEKQTFTKRIEELKNQLSQNSLAKSELENLQKEKADLESKVRDCEARISALNGQIAEQREEIEQQKGQLTGLENNYLLCQQQKKTLSEQVKNLTKQKSSSWWNWQEFKDLAYQKKTYFKWGGTIGLILLIGVLLYKKANSFLFNS